MSNHIQSRRRWQTATGGAIALAIAATSLAAVAAPAFSDPTTTSTSTPVAPTTTTTPIFPSVTVPSADFRSLNRAKAYAAALILERLNSLQFAIKKVQGDSFLGSDGTALVSEMQADITGLQNLGTTIAGENTLAEVEASIRLIFSEFRVYYLMLPVAADVIVVDNAVNVKLPALASSISLLQGAENPSNEAVLAPLIANMQAQSGIVTSATGGLSAQLLSYTPAGVEREPRPAQWRDCRHRGYGQGLWDRKSGLARSGQVPPSSSRRGRHDNNFDHRGDHHHDAHHDEHYQLGRVGPSPGIRGKTGHGPGHSSTGPSPDLRRIRSSAPMAPPSWPTCRPTSQGSKRSGRRSPAIPRSAK